MKLTKIKQYGTQILRIAMSLAMAGCSLGAFADDPGWMNPDFNPDSPGDPDLGETRLYHPVTVKSDHNGHGYVSPSDSFKMYEGEERYIYAYPYTNYELTHWNVNGRDTVAESPLVITMDKEPIDIIAYFKFNPSSPYNPGANSWNPNTGEIIIDDFTPGNLYSVVRDKCNSSLESITSLIVKGVMDYNDMGIGNSLKNAASLDFSRTSGVSELPSYAFESSNASSIALPSVISSIGGYAFYGCQNLTSLTVYSNEPPKVDSNAFASFDGLSECILYVPAASVPLYQDAEGWKLFSAILPINFETHVLQVNLPEDAADGRYKNCSLEIANAATGVRQKYVVSDRMLYTFNGLQKNEQYNVYLLSRSGLEIGRIENVVIPGKDIEVNFDSLKSLHTVFANVLDSEGNDVTGQVSVEWLKPLADGTVTYLRKGESLGEIPEGEQLICRVTLDNRLGVAYAAPEDAVFTAGDGDNTCTVTLAPFRAIMLSGNVVDGDGKGLSDASISINQTLNGKHSKTFTAKTDRKGSWNVSVLDAPETRLTFAAAECVNVNDTIGAFDANVSSFDVGKTTMKSIVGARVTYGFTYHAAGVEEKDEFYNDYQNVAISVFNATQNRAHNDVSLQYPTLAVLDENINPGDELKLTATSKTGAFNPIEQTVTVGDNQRAAVTFDIVGKGGITASFEMTENPAVIAMLYSSKGELLKKLKYSESSALFTELEDGDYTIVSMGQSDLMSSILRLSSFDEIGLTEGKDYVKNTATVESGRLTEVRNSEIPAFDESVFYYTNTMAGFSANKSSITTGNYLTLRSNIDFKNAYKDKVSNVALVVDLPEACDFVEQSIMQGSNLLPYTLDNNRLTVQLGDNYRGQTRFCVIPTSGGTFNATASVVFDYDDKTIIQPIGSATSEIKDIEITVPSVIANPAFKVSGMATANSDVCIYDDGVVLGKGKVNGAGSWNVSCELGNPYNLSKHSIYAEITTPAGTMLTSETKDMTYDMNALQVSKVTMYHWNPELNGWRGNMETSVFDFLNPKTSATHWTVYYPKKVFTYTIEFTDNDPERISNVVLYVHTADGKFVPVNASYDEKKGMWYAEIDMGNSSNSYYPVNVSVDFEYDSKFIVDRDNINKAFEELPNSQAEINAYINEVENVVKDIDNENASDDEWLNAYLEVSELLGIDIDLDFEEFEYSESMCQELINGSKALQAQAWSIDGYLNETIYGSLANLPEEYKEFFNISSCDNLTEADLNPEEFVKFELTDNSYIYVKIGNETFELIDFVRNVRFTMQLSAYSGLSEAMKAAGTIGQISAYMTQIKNFGDKIDGVMRLITSSMEIAGETVTTWKENASKQHKQIMQVLAQMGRDAKKGTPVNGALRFALRLELKSLKSTIAAMESCEKLLSGIGKRVAGLSLAINIANAYNDLKGYVTLYNNPKLQDCPADKSGAEAIRNHIVAEGIGTGVFYALNIATDLISLELIPTGIAGAPLSAGSTLAAVGVAITKIATSVILEKAHSQHVEQIQKSIQGDIDALKCTKDPNPGGDNNGGGNKPGGGANQSGSPSDNVQIDPSGFVYEAVPENRVEGVQASIYYKESKEDMYGDPYEDIVLWNAEEYAQKNPLFTDENGMYRWDVPQGLWQVKFEKDGYQTAYSEWLPVPPPQLEVNIGIVQNKQPEVTEARAYNDGIEVQFDKYMDPSTLTADNIYVTADGEKLAGEIRLIDSALADEYADEENADATRYASRLRFVPEEPLAVTTGEVLLTVSRNVLSYAGIPMAQTFSQTLDVEKEVQDIVADDVKVLYGGEKEVTVYALPSEAAANRTLRISNSSDLIATVDVTEATLDEEGKAVIKVKGDLPGRAQLSFIIDDVAATGSCAVDVVTEIITAEAPVSSRASGTAVYRGTKITLSTDSKGGVIYFTTDGSCPCDENGTRRKYTVPIVINEDTQILAMTAIGEGDGDVSETVEFNYTLKQSDMDFRMPAGWTWISHSLENAVDINEVASDNVEHVLGQTLEAVRDPKLGLVGELKTLAPGEMYKVHATGNATSSISGVAVNPATPIGIAAGWNWLGYPSDQTMSLDEAFANTAAATDDYIVGQDGFAQFDGEAWVGTLDVLNPGMGYMYRSVNAKDVVFNTSIVSKARARYARRINADNAWVADKHAYPSVMPIVAELFTDEDTKAEEGTMAFGAFCGSECRGVGEYVNGLMMMSVYGNIGDEITFRAIDNSNGQEYQPDFSMTFDENMRGALSDPLRIMLKKTTGIDSVQDDGSFDVTVMGSELIVTGDLDAVDALAIFDNAGLKVLSMKALTSDTISLDGLAKGVHVVVIKSGESHTYRKIVVR